MDKCTLKAMAKINLGLDVIRRRADGNHEVRMIMQTIDLYDELTFERLPENELRMTANLRMLPTDRNNLIIRTAELLREEFGIREGLAVHLKKNIPVAAGMAGGSTDAAAVFVAMNRMFGLGHGGASEAGGEDRSGCALLYPGRHGSFRGDRRDPDCPSPCAQVQRGGG